MYGHGFATMYLAQVYGMEEDAKRQERLHRILTKAVAVISGSQSRYGGWYYTPESSSDEGSVTITQLQALRACRNAGITVPVKTIQGAVAYIKKSANSDGGIRYRAQGGGSSRPAITAAAVATLYFAGKYDDPMAEKALQYSLKRMPISGGGASFLAADEPPPGDHRTHTSKVLADRFAAHTIQRMTELRILDDASSKAAARVELWIAPPRDT